MKTAYLILGLLLSLMACNALTVEERTRLQFDALKPKKGANQAAWSSMRVRDEKPASAPAIAIPRVLTTLPVFPPDEEGTTNFPGYFPANATWTFTVAETSPGSRRGPASYGLRRSFDGGKTWKVWTKWINDTFRYDTPTNRFEQSVTLMCDSPINNQLIRVEAWASNSW